MSHVHPTELVERFRTLSRQDIRDSLHRVRAAAPTPENARLKAFCVLARKHINGASIRDVDEEHAPALAAFKAVWDAAK